METKLHPEQRTYAEAIQQSGVALLSLIEDILDFSKIESGTVTLEEDEIEPRQIVEGVVELLAPRAHTKGIELAAVISPDAPELIRIDGIRLRQVLTNLVGNAIKFTEKGGVRVDMRPVEGRERRFLRFEVRDTGVGVPAEKRLEIFDEFVQADSSHARRFGGSGLGLAISKRLVAAMGGEIGIDPAPGGGSLFWFTTPAIAIRDAHPVENERLAGYRIAFITRNAVLREGVTGQIRAAGGEVVGLRNPGAGDENASPNVDAILIDAGTSSQPELPAWPDSRIRSIVLLTPDARGKLADLKALGFAAYLVKPIRQNSLVDRIRARLNGASDSFALPAHGELAQTPIVTTVSDSRPKRGSRSLRILLAEDNPINALLTRELLRRRGHEIKEVTSGESAISVMAEERFDLMLTDIHMPGLDGIEATRRIRADEIAAGRPRTPIVALTADVLETGKRACQEAGMDGFLSKPVDPAELDSMLAELFPLNLEAKAREAAA